MILHGLPQPSWPRQGWTLPELTLAAFYFHPSLDLARGEWALARAGEVTAGAPAPFGLEAKAESIRPSRERSPWALGFAFDFPIVSASKQRAKVDQARATSEASRLNVGTTAWEVRSRLRARLFERYALERQAQSLTAEHAARKELLRLQEKRFAGGVANQTEVAAARLAAFEVETRLGQARARLDSHTPQLAEAIGVAEQQIQAVKIDTENFKSVSQQDFDQRALEDGALADRLDVRRELVSYQAAEAALKLEVAKQYPELRWQPGYTRDQGDNRFGIGLGLTLGLPSTNKGPIAEAMARRELQARRLLALEATVLSEVAQALATYRAGLRALVDAGRMAMAQQERAARVERQFSRGGADRLELAQAQLESILARNAEHAQQVESQRALGMLEAAVQRPLDGSQALGVPYQEPRANPARAAASVSQGGKSEP